MLLSNFYAAANICTPSRAGLLSGRYLIRTGLGYEVIMQDEDRGLPLSEITIARALKPKYATGLFGKWQLGHRGCGAFWSPTRHGLDRFFGIPYSHAMLQRNLLYTGVTRGRRLVVLVGQKKAIAIAVKNVSGRQRWSKLAQWLAPSHGSPCPAAA